MTSKLCLNLIMRCPQKHVRIIAEKLVKSRSFKCLPLLVAGCSVATVCQAQLTNPSFEASGTTLVGWSTDGDARVLDATTANLAAYPTSPPREALISSMTLQSFSVGILAPALETFLGLSRGTLTVPGANVYDGSAIRQTFHAEAGQTLTFNYAFTTDESPATTHYNDFAFAFLTPAGTPATSFDTLATVTGSSLTPISPGAWGNPAYFNQIAPWNTSRTYTIPATGDYTLGIGVVDVYTTGSAATYHLPSGVYVDNVNLSAVPEPKAWSVVAGLGLCAVALVRRLTKSSNLLVRNERTVV
jgi:hypothetical protein